MLKKVTTNTLQKRKEKPSFWSLLQLKQITHWGSLEPWCNFKIFLQNISLNTF